MCEFISWIEKEKKVYFLTDKDIEAKGWEFVDSVGHEAIRKFYGLKGGTDYEVPCKRRIPKEVIKEFKAGHMRQMMKAWGKELEIKSLREVRIKKRYENGQLVYQGFYKDGKPEGEYKGWHKNGQLWYQEFYKDGKLESEYKCWYENGQLIYQGFYKDGKLV